MKMGYFLSCVGMYFLLWRLLSPNKKRALINLTHSEYGLLLAMHSLLNDRKFELNKALDSALKMSTEGKELAILYVESSGEPNILVLP